MPLTVQECMSIGGHCWDYDQVGGYPKVRRCKHCLLMEEGSPRMGETWRQRMSERVEVAISRQLGISLPLGNGSRRGNRDESYARHLAWYVLIDELGYGNAYVAKAYNVDHGTVSQGRATIAAALKHGIDGHVRKDVDAIVAEVRAS